MDKIQIFNNADFGNVRTVLINREPYFVGKDVARILGYSDENKAIAMHVDEEDKKLNDKTSSSFGQRGAHLINESGLYALIIASRLPAAKKFKRWVTSEVLPAIRKTGTYSVPKLEKNPKYRTRMIGTAVRDIRSTAAELQKLFSIKDGIALAKATSLIEKAYGVEMDEIKALIPPAAHDTGSLNPTAIGAQLGGISAREVNLMLQNIGLQQKVDKEWRITAKGAQYGEEMPFERNGHSGYQIRWNKSVIDTLR